MVKPLNANILKIHSDLSESDFIYGDYKAKYLRMWKRMMCNHMLAKPTSKFSECITPDGVLVCCKYCRYSCMWE